jgi:hypothetical protein
VAEKAGDDAAFGQPSHTFPGRAGRQIDRPRELRGAHSPITLQLVNDRSVSGIKIQ